MFHNYVRCAQVVQKYNRALAPREQKFGLISLIYFIYCFM